MSGECTELEVCSCECYLKMKRPQPEKGCQIQVYSCFHPIEDTRTPHYCSNYDDNLLSEIENAPLHESGRGQQARVAGEAIVPEFAESSA